jgi:hypothetical protein
MKMPVGEYLNGLPHQIAGAVSGQLSGGRSLLIDVVPSTTWCSCHSFFIFIIYALKDGGGQNGCFSCLMLDDVRRLNSLKS